MLGSARLQTIAWTSDIARAEAFYGGLLELKLVGRSHGALVYRVGQGELRVSPVPATEPSPHTVFGFGVDDVAAVAARLTGKGLVAERFDGFDHDANGVWRAPDGAKVVWFRDPDGNLFSVVQYAGG